MGHIDPKTSTGYLLRKPDLARKYLSVSIALYDKVSSLEDVATRDYLQELMLDRIVMAHGAFKRTTRDRTPDFDDIVELHVSQDEYLRQVMGNISIHDVGVSDGRSCIGFIRAMQGVFAQKMHYTASDYSPFVYVLSCARKANYKVIVDENDNPLQLVSPPFVFDLVREKPKHYRSLESWVFFWRGERVLKRIMACCREYPEQSHREKIMIIDRQFCEILENNPAWNFKQYNVLDPLQDKYHIVRAMNVLNPGYFDEAELELAVSNILKSLHTGGLFITGSNLDAGSSVDGGIYRKSDAGIECIHRCGAGSPIEEVLVNTNV